MNDEDQKSFERLSKAFLSIERKEPLLFVRAVWVAPSAVENVRQIVENHHSKEFSFQALELENAEIFREDLLILGENESITFGKKFSKIGLGRHLGAFFKKAVFTEPNLEERPDLEKYREGLGFLSNQNLFDEQFLEIFADVKIQNWENKFYDPGVTFLIKNDFEAGTQSVSCTRSMSRTSFCVRNHVDCTIQKWNDGGTPRTKAMQLVCAAIQLPYSLSRLVILCAAIEQVLGDSRSRKDFFRTIDERAERESKYIFDARNDGIHRGHLRRDYREICERALKMFALCICGNENVSTVWATYQRFFTEELLDLPAKKES